MPDSMVVIESGDVVVVVDYGFRTPVSEGGGGDGSSTLELERLAAKNLSGHRAVLLNEVGMVDYASSTDVTHVQRVVGVTLNAAIANEPIKVRTYGALTEPGWNWDTDLPVYLGEDGQLTQVEPASPEDAFSVVVGFPISNVTLFIKPGTPVIIN